MKTLLHIVKTLCIVQIKSGPKNSTHIEDTWIFDHGPHCYSTVIFSYILTHNGRLFPPLASTHPLHLGSGYGGGGGCQGWQWCIRLTYRSDGLRGGHDAGPSAHPPCPLSLSLALAHPCCSAPYPGTMQHPDGGEPAASLPNKNSPSHYSSASPGATRSPASLPGLRIWVCNRCLALPLFCPHSSNYRSSRLFVKYKTFVLIMKVASEGKRGGRGVYCK